MAADPTGIVERQLSLLQNYSDKGPLTESEVGVLEKLVKLQILLRIKGKAASTEDPYSDMTSDELKSLLPLLTE